VLEMKSEPKKSCPRCNSRNITKSGTQNRLKGVVQRYRCGTCGTSFSNDGYYRGKHQLSLLQYAAILYREGLSYEKIQARVKKEFGLYISRQTVGDWMKLLHIATRVLSSGNQKEKIKRGLIEIGVTTVVRQADSFHPSRFIILDSFQATEVLA